MNTVAKAVLIYLLLAAVITVGLVAHVRDERRKEKKTRPDM